MDINHMQRAAQRSYHVNADRIKQQMQQMDKGSAADYRMCDRAEISEEGRNALKEKMAQMGKWERTENIKELAALHSGAYGIMNDFEKIVAGQDGPQTDTFDGHVNKMVHAYQVMK